MSRPFDAGKDAWKESHRVPGAGQQTRHILADNLLQHYGAKPENYAVWCDNNYRMGSVGTNSRDIRIDNMIIGEVFGIGKSYNAQSLTEPTSRHNGLSYQQQLNAIGARFDAAKTAYSQTGEHKYLMIQKDLRDIAEGHLNADLRGFRLSK